MLRATLAAGEGLSALTTDLLIVLSVAAALGLVLQRLRLALVPAYLIAGGIVGPGALGLIASPESLDAIGRLALLLLMFGVGLELHLSTFRRDAIWLLAAGLLACVATTLMGWPVAMLFGLGAPAALLVSMALSLSSTAVVLRIIVQRRELHHTTGRLSFAILIVQDLVVIAYLALIPALASWAGVGDSSDAAASTPSTLADAALGLARLAGIAAIVLLGRWALPKLLFESVRAGSIELMTILAVVAAIAAGLATQALGFSPALGAFLAGFVLSETPFRHQLSGQIGPARDLFVAVFFTYLGMLLDVEALAQWWWAALLAGLAMSVVKGLGIGGACWVMGATPATAVVVGLALSQAGEFSLVVLQSAQPTGLLSPSMLSVVVAVVVLSLILTPILMQLGRAVSPLAGSLPAAPWTRRSPLAADTARDEAVQAPQASQRPPLRAVIGGFGPIGRSIARRLEQASVPYTVVEMNPRTVLAEERAGRRIVFGDVGSADVLRSAGIEQADALILTIPDTSAAARACHNARALNPDIFILCRAPLLARRELARGQGASVVVVDELATARAMERELVRALSARRRAQRSDTPNSPQTSQEDAAR